MRGAGVNLDGPTPATLWRWAVYRFVTGPHFPAARAIIWAAQIPLVVILPTLASRVMYVTVLSIAAGIESAWTDLVDGWKFVTEAPPDEPG